MNTETLSSADSANADTRRPNVKPAGYNLLEDSGGGHSGNDIELVMDVVGPLQDNSVLHLLIVGLIMPT